MEKEDKKTIKTKDDSYIDGLPNARLYTKRTHTCSEPKRIRMKKKRLKLIELIMRRAIQLGLVSQDDKYEDIYFRILYADVYFNLRLNGWLNGKDKYFIRDFQGIQNNFMIRDKNEKWDAENEYYRITFGHYVPYYIEKEQK